MLERIIRAAIAHRWLMMVLTLALVAIGSWSFARLPIDATPDITNVQVQINTAAEGYSPLEAEQRITYPVETVMAGLPKLEQVRSLSRYGLSQVTVVFKDGTDLYFARQQVSERLQAVRAQLPPGLEPAMGPISTGMGEILIDDDYTGPWPAAAFSIMMLLGTLGQQFSLAEFKGILESAGFVDVQSERTGGGYYSLVSARKP